MILFFKYKQNLAVSYSKLQKNAIYFFKIDSKKSITFK